MQWVWFELVQSLELNKLAAKLKKAKIALNSWNKSIYGEVDLNIQELETWLIALEDILQRGHNKEVEMEFMITKSKLECWEKGRKLGLPNLLRSCGLRKEDKILNSFMQ